MVNVTSRSLWTQPLTLDPCLTLLGDLKIFQFRALGLSEMEIKNYVVLYDEYLIAQVLEYWISSLLQIFWDHS